MAQKKNKELSSEILVLKKSNLTRNERPGKDPQVCLPLHNLVIPRALRVTKKAKKPKGFILRQMRIDLNGTFQSELASYASTQFEKYIPKKKAFTTQSLKYILYPII